MKEKTHSVLFRCDGSSTIGIGHVMRCLALADELRRAHGATCGFALRSDESGARLIQNCEYPVFRPDGNVPFSYKNWLCELVRQARARAVVLDVRDDLPVSALEALRNSEVLLVTIDDPSPKRLQVDLAFYPPVPQIDRMDWTGFKGRLFKGWDWVPLRRKICETPSYARRTRVKSLLVTAGGADPAGMTIRIVKLLNSIQKPFETVIAVGPAYQHLSELEKNIAASSGSFRIENDPENLPALMAETDLAITSFGVTAYELAAMGVPAAYLCLTKDHEESASLFVKKGLGISLGLLSEIDEMKFRQKLEPLLTVAALRQKMSREGQRTVDGMGAKRISDLIVKQWQKEHEHD